MVKKITKKLTSKAKSAHRTTTKTTIKPKPKVAISKSATKRKVVGGKQIKTKSSRKTILVRRVSFSPIQWKEVQAVLTANNCHGLQEWILQSMKLKNSDDKKPS